MGGKGLSRVEQLVSRIVFPDIMEYTWSFKLFKEEVQEKPRGKDVAASGQTPTFVWSSAAEVPGFQWKGQKVTISFIQGLVPILRETPSDI